MPVGVAGSFMSVFLSISSVGVSLHFICLCFYPFHLSVLLSQYRSPKIKYKILHIDIQYNTITIDHNNRLVLKYKTPYLSNCLLLSYLLDIFFFRFFIVRNKGFPQWTKIIKKRRIKHWKHTKIGWPVLSIYTNFSSFIFMLEKVMSTIYLM
jgi:hypothetical protein